jgi:hypothetical protein
MIQPVTRGVDVPELNRSPCATGSASANSSGIADTGKASGAPRFVVADSRAALLCAGVARWSRTWLVTYEALGRRRPLVFSMVTVVIFMSACLAVFTPSYQTNDDAWMAMIVAGKGISLAPDEHLIFSNVVVGRVLRALYTTCPNVPWYGCHLYLAQTVSQIAMLYCVVVHGYSRRALLLYAAYFATVGVYFLNNLQFTTTAFLAAQSGAMLCAAGLMRRAQLQSGTVAGPLVCGVLLLVWGALVRTDGYVLVLLCSAAPACIALGNGMRVGREANRAVIRPLACALGASLALVIGFVAYNDAYYGRDPQWREFYQYNRLRLKFNDYQWTSYTPDTAAIFDAAAWTENDHAMIAHWFFDDATRYGEGQLRQVLDGHPWWRRRLSVAYCASAVREMLRDKTTWIIALALPAFLWSLRGKRRAAVAALASVLASVLLLVVLAIMTKPPPSRVYVPLLAFPLAVTLLASSGIAAGATVAQGASSPDKTFSPIPETSRLVRMRGSRARRRATALVTTVLVIVAVCMGLARQYRRSVKAIAARSALAEYVRELSPKEDQLYVTWASSFPFEAISPFDNLKSFAPFRIMALSWPQTTPLARRMKRAFGIEDLPRALYERPDVRLIAEEPLLPLYATYVREHYGRSIEVVRGETSGAGGTQTVRRRDPSDGRLAAREPETLPPVSWRVVR